MPRSGRVKRRVIAADLLYGNKLVSRLVNQILKHGKKSLAQKIVYGALDIIAQNSQDPLATLETAVRNVGPRMEVRSRRVGGASYQVPAEVRGDRKESLAIRWIIQSNRARSVKEFLPQLTKQQRRKYPLIAYKLAAELQDAAVNKGLAIKKRDDVLRMAEANKAFAHFRW